MVEPGGHRCFVYKYKKGFYGIAELPGRSNGLLVLQWFPLCAKCVTVGTDEEPHMHISQHLELAKRNFQGAKHIALGAVVEGACCWSSWMERKEGIKGYGAKGSKDAMIQRKGCLTSMCLHNLFLLSTAPINDLTVYTLMYVCVF